jgi:hypothetical protein
MTWKGRVGGIGEGYLAGEPPALPVNHSSLVESLIDGWFRVFFADDVLLIGEQSFEHSGPMLTDDLRKENQA